MGIIISFFNQKGGVAKTTSVVNVGAFISASEKKVLVVDMDPQASATVTLGVNDADLKATIFDLLKDRVVTKEQIQEVIIKTEFDNLDLLPSNITLSNADLEIAGFISRESLLKNILLKVKDDYDYILIDCPPNLGLMSINSLTASNYIIIPVSPNFLSVYGIKHLMQTYKLIKSTVNPDLEILGILITLFDGRKNKAKETKKALINQFEGEIFETIIRTNVEIEKSQFERKPILYYSQKCNAFTDYSNLTEEILSVFEGDK